MTLTTKDTAALCGPDPNEETNAKTEAILAMRAEAQHRSHQDTMTTYDDEALEEKVID